MIESPIDGSNLNQGTYLGKNWLGSGGVASDQAFDAKIKTIVLLQGGCEAAPALGGNVEARLVGGVIASSFVWCNWLISPRVTGGMFTTEEAGGNIHIWPKLLGGYFKTSAVGGNLKTDTRLLTQFPLWSNTSIGGAVVISGRVLSGGLSSNSEVFGDLARSVRVLFSGTRSSSDVGGLLTIKNKRVYLQGGIYSTSLVSALFKNTVRLAPKTGIYSLSKVGGEGKVMPRTTYGVMSTNSVGDTPIHCGRGLNGAVYSSSKVNAAFKISFAANYGAYSTETIGGKYRISPVLTPIVIVYKRSKCDSNSLRISPHLNEGIVNNSFTSSRYVVSAYMLGGITNSANLGGQLKTEIFLQGNLFAVGELSGILRVTVYLKGYLESRSSLIASALRSEPKLQKGIVSSDLVSSKYTTSIVLSGGINSNNSFVFLYPDAALRINAILKGGVESSSYTLGKYRISANLSKGVLELYELQASYKISPMFRFAAYSNAVSGGTIKLSPNLQGGTDTNVIFSSKFIINPKLSFNMKSFESIGGKYFTTIKLSHGMYSSCKVGMNLKLNPILQGLVQSSAKIGGAQNISAILHNGVFSFSIARGELAASFKDPNLNTWAIYLKSATQHLSLKTPKEDV